MATFGGLLALSVLTVAATDHYTLAIGTVLGVMSLLHRTGISVMPWWLIAILMVVALGRFGYLLAFYRHRLIVVRAWGQACQITARRCSKREA